MTEGSYLLLEPGMAVLGRDGYLGVINEVVADEMLDIFRGFVLSADGGHRDEMFVPAQYLAAVSGHTATVDLSKAEVMRLEPMASLK